MSSVRSSAGEAAAGSRELRGWAVAAWPCLLLLLLYLMFIGGGWAGIYSVHLRLATTILGVLAIVSWLTVAALRPVWRPSSAIWPALLGALAAFSVATATARQPRLALDYLAYAVLLAALYLMLVALLRHPPFRRRLEGTVVILAIGIPLIYLVVVVGHWIDWWAAVGRVAIPPLRPAFEGLTYGNPSAVATMSILLAASASAIALVGVGTRRRLSLSLAVVSLATAAVVTSGSRGAWLGIGIAAVVAGGLWLAGRPQLDVASRIRSRRTAAAAGAALMLAVLVMGAVGPAILGRLTGGGGEELRATLNATAVRMFAESPATGLGPGAWVDARISHTEATELDYYIPHAHNIYTQTAAELGLAGLAAGVMVVVVMGWLVLRALHSGDRRRRAVGWATLFSLVYIGAHQIVDFYPNMPAVLFALAFPVAWLDAAERVESRAARVLSGRPFAVVLLVLTTISVGWLMWSERHALAASDGVAAANEGDWAAAREDFALAIGDGEMPPYGLELGIAAAFSNDLVEARSRIAQFAEQHDLPQAWLDLAWIEHRQGDDEGARDALLRAMRLGWQQPIVGLGAGTLYHAMDDEEMAQEAYVQAVLAEPSLAGDPAWTGDARLAPLWPSVLDTVLARADPVTGYEAALVAGDADRAAAIAASLDPPTRRVADLVIGAWEGDPGAYESLEGVAQGSPLDTYPVEWLARIASRYGDGGRAERYQTWGEIANPFFRAAEMRTTTRPVAGIDVAGSLARFFGHYTYRRPTPWDLLAPELPRLVFE